MDAPPADYMPAAHDRIALWAATPDATKAYISQLHARADEASAVVQQVWAMRFKGPFEYKEVLLKMAHAVVSKRLRNEWDAERLPAGMLTDLFKPFSLSPSRHSRSFSGDGQQLTLRNLGSDLLERILARTDSTCASVAPIFEATLIQVAGTQYDFFIPAIDPPQRHYGMVRAAMARCMSSVVIGIHVGVVSQPALMTAIAALRQHSGALRSIDFVNATPYTVLDV